MNSFIMILFILTGIAVAIYSIYKIRKRQKEWQQFASNHGFLYSRNVGIAEVPVEVAQAKGETALTGLANVIRTTVANSGSRLKYDTRWIPESYSEHHLFREGHSRKVSNLCQGIEKDLKILAFDYQYTTGSGKNSQTHYLTPLIIESNLVFKPLIIRPENVFDKIGAAVGFDDIDFESAEFSKKYYVKCDDKKFAYDIIHARMMEFLLECRNMNLEAQNNSILFHQGKILAISEVELLLIAAKKFVELTPDYVRKEYS